MANYFDQFDEDPVFDQDPAFGAPLRPRVRPADLTGAAPAAENFFDQFDGEDTYEPTLPQEPEAAPQRPGLVIAPMGGAMDAYGLGETQAPGAPMLPQDEAAPPAMETPDRFEGETFGALARRRGQEVAAGAADVIASIPESVAITGAAADEIRRQGAESTGDQRAETIAGMLERLADPNLDPKTRAFIERNLADMEIGQQEIGRRASADVVPARERPIYAAGDRIRERSKEFFGEAPADDSFWSSLAQGAGSMIGFVGATAAGGVVAGPGGALVTGAGAGSALNQSSIYKEAIESGASEDVAMTAAQWGAVVGTAEVVPILSALKFLPPRIRGQVTNRVAKYLGNIAINAGEEAAQEAANQIANNLIASNYYDPDRGWAEGVGEAAAVGAILGGGLSAAAGAPNLARGEGAGPEAPSAPTAPAQPQAPAPGPLRLDRPLSTGIPQPERAAPAMPEPDPERLSSPRLTASDRASPIPNAKIDDGKAKMEQLLGQQPDVPEGAVPFDAMFPVEQPDPMRLESPLPLASAPSAPASISSLETIPAESADTTSAPPRKRLRNATLQKRPFTYRMRQIGIDPDSPAADELRAGGITPQNTPGLFRADGIKDVDNLPASDWGDMAYQIGIETDADGGQTYLSRQGVINALIDELAGNPVQDGEQMRLQSIADQKYQAEQETLRRAIDWEPDDTGDIDIPEPFFAPPSEQDDFAFEGQPDGRLNAARNAVENAVRVLGDNFGMRPDEAEQVAQRLNENGGYVEDAILSIIRANVESEQSNATDQENEIPGFERDPGQRAQATAEPQPDAGAAPGVGARDQATGRARGGTKEGGAVDVTPEGEQLVIPGAEQITDRERAERQQARPLRGGDAALPGGGLFDEGSRAQRSLLDTRPDDRGTGAGDQTADGEAATAAGADGATGQDAEPAPAESGTAAADQGEGSPRVEDRSDKSIIVRGLTKADASMFDGIKGRALWNDREQGFVISRKYEAEVRAIVEGGDRAAAVEAAAAEADPNPTEAQKEAGNFKKGHVTVQGLDITIENAKGSQRTGTDSDGETWSVTMPAHYGYIKRTEGADGDHVDVYLGESVESEYVVVVNQVDADTGAFDEHKVILGTTSRDEALDLYRGAFSDGKADQRIGSTTTWSMGRFKSWLLQGDLSKPTDKIDMPYLSAAQKSAAKRRATKAKKAEGAQPKVWKRIGKNANEDPLFEDENGVRSYTEDGVRVSETVFVVPGRGLTIDKSKRDERFNTQDEQTAIYEKEIEENTKEKARIDAEALKTKPDMAAVEAAGFTLGQNGYRLTEGRKTWIISVGRKSGTTEWRIRVWRSTKPEGRVGAIPDKELGYAKDAASALELTAKDGAPVSVTAENEMQEGGASPDLNAQITRLQQVRDLLDETTMPPNTGEWAAKTMDLRQAAEFLNRGDIEAAIPILSRASQRLMRRFGPIANVIDEIETALEGMVGAPPASSENAEAKSWNDAKIGDRLRGPAEGGPKFKVRGKIKKWEADGLVAKVGGYRTLDGDLYGVVGPESLSQEQVKDLLQQVRDERATAAPAAAPRPNAARDALQNAVTGAIERGESEPIVEKPSNYGANNKLVSQDRAAELRARLRDKLKNQLNAGIDPEILAIGTELAVFHIEAGARRFADMARAIADDLGTTPAALRPYLRSWYNGARDMMEDNGLDIEGMDDAAAVREALAEIGTEAAGPAAADFQTTIRDAFRAAFGDGRSFRTIVEARKFASEALGRDVRADEYKAMEEAIEQAVVIRARRIAQAEADPAAAYRAMVDLYAAQPKLNQRTSTSVERQAYSTPVPLAYLASRLGDVKGAASVYEPTAGHGALLVEARTEQVEANELDADRSAFLESLFGADRVTTENAIGHSPQVAPEVIIANPPFGVVKGENGKNETFPLTGTDLETTQIDHAIVMSSLDNLGDDGRAVLIIGGQKGDDAARKRAYQSGQNRRFFNALYRQYRVIEHFTLDGALYDKQGAGWPVDVIVIDGRGQAPKALPMAEVPPMYDTWDALGGRLDGTRDSLDTRSERGVDRDGTVQVAPETPDAGRLQDGADVQDRPADRGRGPGGRGGDAGRGGARGTAGGVEQPARGGRDAGAVQQPATERNGDTAGNAAAAGQQDQAGSGRDAGSVAGRVLGDAVPRRAVERNNTEVESAYQVQYEPRSQARFFVGTLVPRNMQDAMSRALDALEAEVGNIDEYVAARLDYTLDELLGTDAAPGYFSAEQVDALALAISNVERGAAFIVGDQTGVGKGRFVAAMLRYAMKQGIVPVFVTKEPGLYADMVRDLRDIGMDGIEKRLLLTNYGIRGKDVIPLDGPGDVLEGKTKRKLDADIRSILATGQLPNGIDMLFTTYHQLQLKNGEETARMGALRRLAPNAMLVLDESHEAGGSGKDQRAKEGDITSRADFVRDLLRQARSAVFSSATYAKNPNVMSLYAKTDIGLSVDNAEDLPGLISKGGVPLQQVIANMLVEAGQYVRRERSFDGVSMDMDVLDTDRTVGDTASTLLRNIFRLDADVMDEVRKEHIAKMKEEGHGGAIDNAVGSESASSTNFSAIMHVVISQMLLSLKSRAAVQKAVSLFREGKKPIIALSNTNESILDDVVSDLGISEGDAVDLPFNVILERYVDRLRRITLKDKETEKTRYIYLSDDDIRAAGGEYALDAFRAVREAVRSTRMGDLPGSPIDLIIDEMEAAGMNVGEITGREIRIANGVLTRRDASPAAKKRVMNAYNSGALDALVINKSGSTGFSMHATDKPRNDGKKRHMIILQPDPNIDVFMQMLGRIHRTGQTELPGYTIGVSDLAIEKRLAAVLMRKMASLNANTTASKKSAVSLDNVTDFLNAYGDKVVADYLRENYDIARMLDMDPGEKDAFDNFAAKFTGRLAILPPDQVAQIYEDIERSYTNYIDLLEAMGQNALEAKALDLQAETIESTEIVAAKGRGSPFTEAANIETMSVRVLGKPMSPAQVDEEVAKALGGDSAPEWQRKRDAEIDALMPAAMKQIDEGIERANAQIAEAKTDKQKDRAQDMLNRFENRRASVQVLVRDIKAQIKELAPGKAFIIQAHESKEPPVYGVSLGVDTSKLRSATAPSQIIARIAVADAAREIRFPISRLFGMDAEYTIREVPRTDGVMQAFEDGQADRRETRQMITGNLIAGLEKMQAGRIVLYTDTEGRTKSGILLPKTMDARKELAKRPAIFKDPQHAITFLDGNARKVESSDGIVDLTRNDRGVYTFRIQTRGHKPYTLSPGARAILGDFEQRRGNEWYSATTSDPAQARDVLKVYQDTLGSVFQTAANKDEARAITGEAMPDIPSTGEGEGATRFKVSQPRRGEAPGGAFRLETATTTGEVIYAAARPEVMERSREIVNAVAREAQAIGLTRVSTKVVEDMIGKDADGQQFWLSGFFDRNPEDKTSGLIRVTLADPERSATFLFNHEAVHALRSKDLWGTEHGLFTASEWAALEAAAVRDTDKMAVAARDYADSSREIQIEEVIADRYGEWREGRLRAQNLELSAFRKIQRWMQAVSRAFRKLGFTKPDDVLTAAEEAVFRDIEAGRVGARGAAAGRGAGQGAARFARAPGINTEAFKQWFGDSKVVDANGRPLVVYHGGPTNIDQFENPNMRWREFMMPAAAARVVNAVYFTSDRAVAETYVERSRQRADQERDYDRPVGVHEVYLSIQSPMIIDLKGERFRSQGRLIDQAREGGFDGMIVRNAVDDYEQSGQPTTVFVTFAPTQIKSVDNAGTFDPANPSIRFARARGNAAPRPDEGPNDGPSVDEAPPKQDERISGVVQAIREGAPLDAVMRIPFDIIGGFDRYGAWRPGKGMFNAFSNRLINGKLPDIMGMGYLNHPLEHARRGLIDRYGLDPDYIEADRRRGLTKQRITMEGAETLQWLAKHNIGADEAKVLQAVLTGEAVPAAEMAKLAAPIRASIDALGQEAVELGLISAESYERNKGSYLHRVYERHEVEQNMLGRYVSNIFAQRRMKIQGDAFKGRGIFNEVGPARLMRDWPGYNGGLEGLPQKGDKVIVLDLMTNTDQGDLDAEAPVRGRLRRRVYWPANKPIPGSMNNYENRGTFEVRGRKGTSKGADFILWRDFSKEERMKMGEILDARYTIARTYMTLSHDLAAGRFFKEVAENEEWAQKAEPQSKWLNAGEYRGQLDVEWIKVPNVKIGKSNAYKYGALSDMFVRAEIWRDLQQMERMQQQTVWDSIMRQWKMNKTARSPAVHMNNIMSNVMLMDMAGITARDLYRGMVSMYRQDAAYREAQAAGAFGSDMVSQEMREKVLKPMLDEIRKDMEQRKGFFERGAEASGIPHLIPMMQWVDQLLSLVKPLDAAMTSAYQMEDEVFRMALYLRRKRQGASPEHAALEARDQFINYDIRAPWINWLRRYPLPFLSYSYRAVPMVAKTVATRPWKVAKYYALAYGLNSLAYAIAPSDYDEEEERRSMREEEQGYLWIGTQRMIRLPMLDDYDNPVFLDIRRFVPAGDVFDTNQGHAVLNLPGPMQPGGLLMMGAELALNRQAFTGDPIVNEITDTPGERVAATAGYLYKAWMPSAAWIPGSWYFDKIRLASQGARDFAGRPMSVPQQVASSVGIKIRPQDVPLGYQFHEWRFDKVERELRTQSRQLERDAKRGLITMETYDRKMNTVVEKLLRLDKKRFEVMTGEEMQE